MTRQVSTTMVHTVDLPRPNRLDSVRYSMFVASFQRVTATHSSTLTGSLTQVWRCIYGHTSEQRALKVCLCIRKFSFHHSSPNLSNTTSLHHCLLLGLTHTDLSMESTPDIARLSLFLHNNTQKSHT